MPLPPFDIPNHTILHQQHLLLWPVDSEEHTQVYALLHSTYWQLRLFFKLHFYVVGLTCSVHESEKTIKRATAFRLWAPN